MGFASEYDQPITHNFEGTKYWVKFRNGLTGRQRDFLREHYMEQVPVEGQPGVFRMMGKDPFKSRLEEMLMAIHSWNLTGDNDQPLPFEHDPFEEMKSGVSTPLRNSWPELPAEAQDELFEAYRDATRKTGDSEANARFPEGGESGDHVGHDQAPDDSEVLVGSGVPPQVGDQG